MFAASWRNGRRHHTLAHASPAQLSAPAKHRAHEAKRTEVRLSPRPSGSTAQLRHGHSVVNWFGVSIRQHTPTCKRAVFVSSLSPAHEPATGAAESGAACDSAARCPCYCAMRSRHAPQRSSTPASTASTAITAPRCVLCTQTGQTSVLCPLAWRRLAGRSAPAHWPMPLVARLPSPFHCKAMAPCEHEMRPSRAGAKRARTTNAAPVSWEHCHAHSQRSSLHDTARTVSAAPLHCCQHGTIAPGGDHT